MSISQLNVKLNEIANEKSNTTSAVLCRDLLVDAIDYIYAASKAEKPEHASLLELLDSPVVITYINDADIINSMHYVRILGMNAKHGKNIKKREAKLALDNITYVIGLINAKANGTGGREGLFCKVVYLYKSLQPYIRTSAFDTAEYAFPYTEEQMKRIGGVHYTSPFGPRWGKIHRGVDLQPANQANEPVHAVHDGTITAAGDGWGSACNAVNIDHGNGTYSRYLHLNSVSVKKGQKVKKGDVVGTTGGYGASGPNSYALHLHLEIAHGQSEVDYSNEDPMKFFNCTGISVGETLFADGTHKPY